MTEKRVFKRSQVYGLVSFEGEEKGSHLKGKAHLLDLSNGGLSFLSTRRLDEGSVVRVSFWLPGYDDIKVPTLAKVRWARELGASFKTGLQFTV